MADRYLIETSATDGYQLEDGTGVLLLDVAAATTEESSSSCVGTHGAVWM